MSTTKSSDHSELSKLVDKEVYARLPTESHDLCDQETTHDLSVTNEWWWTEAHERRLKEKRLANRIRALGDIVGRTARSFFVKQEPWDPATRPLPGIPKGELPRELALGRLYLDSCPKKETENCLRRRRQGYRNDIKRALWRLTNSRPITNVQVLTTAPKVDRRYEELGKKRVIETIETDTHAITQLVKENSGDSAATRPMSERRHQEFSNKKLKRILETIHKWEKEAYKELTGHEMMSNGSTFTVLEDVSQDETLLDSSSEDESTKQLEPIGSKRKREPTVLESYNRHAFKASNSSIGDQARIQFDVRSIGSIEPLLGADDKCGKSCYIPLAEMIQDNDLMDNLESPSPLKGTNNDDSYVTHWDMEVRSFEPVETAEKSLVGRLDLQDSPYITHEDMESRCFRTIRAQESMLNKSHYLTQDETDYHSMQLTKTSSSSEERTSNVKVCDFNKLHSGYVAWKRLNKLRNRVRGRGSREKPPRKLPQAWRWLAFIERKFDIDFEDSSGDESDQQDLCVGKENRGHQLKRSYSWGDRLILEQVKPEDDRGAHSDIENLRKKELVSKKHKPKISARRARDNKEGRSGGSSEMAGSFSKYGRAYEVSQTGASERQGEEWIPLGDWLDKEESSKPSKPIPRIEGFETDQDFCLLYDLSEIKRRFGNPQYQSERSEEIKNLVSRAINAIYLRCLCKMRVRLRQKQEAKRLASKPVNNNQEKGEKMAEISATDVNATSLEPEKHLESPNPPDYISDIQIVATSPFMDQIPDEDGLIRPVEVFQQPHYIENYVQSILDANDGPEVLVLGGEMRYFSKKALHSIARVCIGNQVRKLIIPNDCIMTTATASHLIRKCNADGGIVLTGSVWPAGRDGFFGIRYYDKTGANISEQDRGKISEKSTTISRFKIYNPDTLSGKCFKTTCVVGATIFKVVDAAKSHADFLKRYIPLDMIHFRLFNSLHKTHSLYRPEWKILVDCRHGATGPLAQSLFHDCLQIPQECILHSKPLNNFGGYDAVPNMTTAADFIERVKKQNDTQLGIAFSANGERCLIVTKAGPLSMCDVTSVIAKLIPLVSHYDLKSHVSFKGVWNPTVSCSSNCYARTYASSSILDRMAIRYGIPCQVVPTAAHFWYLMDAGKADVCSDENFGIALNHLREMDAMFVALIILYFLARSLKDLNSSLEWVWRDFGREYMLRHDFKDVDYSKCALWIRHLDVQLNFKMALNQTYGKDNGYLCTACGRFDYRNPVTDCWTQYTYPIQATFNHNARVSYKVTRTGYTVVTVSVWVSEWSKEYDHNNSSFLEDLMTAAYDLGKIPYYLERSEPDVTV